MRKTIMCAYLFKVFAVVVLFAIRGVYAADVTVHVGVYAPFSNEEAPIGRNILAALEIAREQLSSPNVHYEFYTLDNLPFKKTSHGVLQKFINTHHLDVIITDTALRGTQWISLAKKNHLIHFCLMSENFKDDGQNNFKAYRKEHLNKNWVSQLAQEYQAKPSRMTAFTWDVFQRLHHGVLLSLKKESRYSTQWVATDLQKELKVEKA